MAWIKVIDEDDAEGALRELYGRVRESRGKVSNVFRVQSLRPEIMEAHLDLYVSVMFGQSGLTRAQREMIAVTVSAANHCEYCVLHHSAALSKYVKDSSLVKEIGRGHNPASLSPKERGMLDYAMKLTNDLRSIREADIQELRSLELTEEEILTLTIVTGYFNFVNRIVEGLGVRLEEDRGEGYLY